MANLSNINNKFIVSDAGHVSIGATTTTYPLTVESGGVGTVLRAGTAFVSIDSVGTAASPSLIFNGDDNTGIFRAAADTLAFSTAGSERMRIDSSGTITTNTTAELMLSLNTTAANGGYLRFRESDTTKFFIGARGAVSGGTGTGYDIYTAAGNDLRLWTAGSTALTIDTSQNVGIGTDSPDIGSVAGTRVLTIASPTAERWGILELAGNRTWGGNQVGEIKFISTDATNNGVLVSLIAINDPSATGTGGSLKFSTRTDGGSLTERMRITSGGSLEVGTATVAAPNAAADNIVIKGEGTAVGLTISNSSNSGTGTIFFGDAASSAAAGFRYNHNTGDMSISAEDNITFTCDNVGIGTTSPQALLDVTKNSDEVYDFSQDLGQRSGTATIHINNNSTTVGSFGQIMYDSDGSNQGIARIVFIDSGTASVDTAFVNEINNTKKETLRIKANGNVGIGTAAPSKTLQVSSSATGDLMNILCVNTHDTDGDTASIGFSMVDLNYQKAAVIFERTTTQGRGSLHFATNNVAGNNNVSKGDARMTILSGGNVGIGLTDPDNKLHVKGDMVTIEDPSGGFKMELSADADPVTIRSDNLTGAAYGQIAFVAGNGSGSNDQTRMVIDNSGNVGIGITSPNTKLDVSGATGTRNRNTQGSSVYETSLYFNAAGNATTNISINTTTAFPPIASGGFILVEVSASGYGNSGSNGLVFSYISGGYGGHYGGQGQPYHPVEIIANTMQAGSCTFYYPNSTTIGIAVTTTNSVGLNGLMRVKVTSTY